MKHIILLVLLVCAFTLRINYHQDEQPIPVQGNDTTNGTSTLTYDEQNGTGDSLSLTISPINQYKIPIFPREGGFEGRDVSSPDDLDEDEKALYDFIVENVPDVQGYALFYVESQVVAGSNTCFHFITYDDTVKKYCIWSKPWQNNYLRLKTPEGDIFESGGWQITLTAVPQS